MIQIAIGNLVDDGGDDEEDNDDDFKARDRVKSCFWYFLGGYKMFLICWLIDSDGSVNLDQGWVMLLHSLVLTPFKIGLTIRLYAFILLATVDHSKVERLSFG